MALPIRKKPYTCPHCKEKFRGQGFSAHVRVCAIRHTLTDVDLRTLWERTQNLTALAKYLTVSRATLAAWLDDLSIPRTPGPPRKTRPPLELYHGLTPIPRAPHGGCANCPATLYCQDTVQPEHLRWILCEAIDPRQLRAWQRRGLPIIDLAAKLHQIRTTLEAAL